MKKSYLFLITVLFLPLFSSCSSNSSAPTKPRVLVSIPPYLYFVEKIAGDVVEVSSLAPEGTNPHIFEPSPKQIQEVYQAKVWIKLGESFEQKIAMTLSAQHKNLIVVDLSKEVPLYSDHHGCACHGHGHAHTESADLHIWMSPILAKLQASAIAKALTEAFPEHEGLFNQRLEIFQKELDELYVEIKEKLSPYVHQAVLVSHPAFGYFCRDFDIEQISIEVEGKEPRPQDISSVLERAAKASVRLVLIQEQYNNKGALAIASKMDIPTFSTDPYSRNYKQTLLDITAQIVAGHE
ncbi:MAG: zinc ABC transporter substrate-binding protein [Chlamydiae bacterium]|nr:zinc ABC transporter substrate-binding protein [Chlamydiota bacterium]